MPLSGSREAQSGGRGQMGGAMSLAQGLPAGQSPTSALDLMALLSCHL